MKSPKELSLEKQIIEITTQIIEGTFEKDDLPLKIVQELIHNEEIEAIQDYANNVSIVRLGYNDHGPVHMRTVCRNCLKMLQILYTSGVKTSLEIEQAGTFLDSVTAVIIASFFHDFGMTVGRQDHELYSVMLGQPIIDSILKNILPNKSDLKRRVIIRSMALEGIIGHMGTRKVHSLEAGLILIADGCDMTKGRARIPMELSTKPSVGDIHKYSANSIEKVKIEQGSERPIKIEVKIFFITTPLLSSTPTTNSNKNI